MWVNLCLLGLKRGIPEDIMHLIHRAVTSSLAAEESGLDAYMCRWEREESARRAAGAERLVPKWKLLGFGTLSEYLFHVREESARELLAVQRALPMYVRFGFTTETEYRDATRCALVANGRSPWGEA